MNKNKASGNKRVIILKNANKERKKKERIYALKQNMNPKRDMRRK